MPESTSDIAQAVSAAVTGPSTPDNVSTSRPTKESVFALYGGTIIPAFLGTLIIIALAWSKWPESAAPARITYLGALGVLAMLCQPITVIALASSRLGRVEASAGTNHIALEGRQ